MESREAGPIQDTIVRYAHLVDRGRIDELLELFAEDATLEAGDAPPAHGRAAIRAFFTATGERLAAATARPMIRHHVSSVLVTMETPDAATADSYFLAVTERGPDHWGRYRDRLVRREGRWVFQHRRVRVDGRAAGSVFARP
ncbi:MAG TPA: nuclear transport factor 2 family protein [Candidatus Binatia bacterium]|nr:nuclear transport factor 2 family protein [Candidatus Binatia bacterium]